jgi:amino acid transporter
MALVFLLTFPFLFSVPVSLATAEMSTAMPVEGNFYRWTRAAFGDFWDSNAAGGTRPALSS